MKDLQCPGGWGRARQEAWSMEAGSAQAEARLHGVREPVGFVWIPQGSELGNQLQASVEPSSIGRRASGA